MNNNEQRLHVKLCINKKKKKYSLGRLQFVKGNLVFIKHVAETFDTVNKAAAHLRTLNNDDADTLPPRVTHRDVFDSKEEAVCFFEIKDNAAHAEAAQSVEKPLAVQSKINKAQTYRLYFDGGSRGNGSSTSVAGSGFLITSEAGVVIAKGHNYMGSATNNQAEYDGLERGLAFAVRMGLKTIACYGDSNLVVNQMKGTWKINNDALRAIHDRISLLAMTFDNITYTHVYREHNRKADALANMAMDKRTSCNTLTGE